MECNNQCEHCKYNKNIINMLKNELPTTEIINDLSNVFKIFGDPTRMRILWVLFSSEKCVAEICGSLKMSQSAISHQLKVLKEARLVRSRRDGKNTFYALGDEHIENIIEQVLIHINEQAEN